MGSALEDFATKIEPFLTGTDAAAIHVDVAGDITAITLKAAPAIDDVLVLEDAADAEAKKSATIGAVLKAAGQVSNLSAAVPLIGDKIAFEDQSDSDAMKVATVQEIVTAAGWMSGATAATPLAADVVVFEDASDSLAIKKTTIGALPIAQSQVSGSLVAPAADAAAAILDTTRAMRLTVTGAGNVAISTSSSYAGQVVNLFAVAVAGGGSYTLALDSGTLTLNATSESAVIMREGANWVCVGLSGATIV